MRLWIHDVNKPKHTWRYCASRGVAHMELYERVSDTGNPATMIAQFAPGEMLFPVISYDADPLQTMWEIGRTRKRYLPRSRLVLCSNCFMDWEKHNHDGKCLFLSTSFTATARSTKIARSYMSQTYPVGTEVYAKTLIQERDFPTPGNIHIHAAMGEVGKVVFNDGSLIPTVRWNRTGTATIVNVPNEIAAVDGQAPTSDIAHAYTGGAA